MYNCYRVETDKQLCSDASTPSSVSNDDCPTTFTGLPLTSLATLSPSTSSSVEVDSESPATCATSSSISSYSPSESATPSSDGQIDLGTFVQAANGSWDRLNALINKLPDDRKKQYLSFHSKPSSRDCLHSHPVTKMGRTWNDEMAKSVSMVVIQYSPLWRYL